MCKRELIGAYPGETANVEEIVRDIMNYIEEKEHEEPESNGFTYVGSYDKNSTEEEKDALVAKAIEMHEKHFFGED